MEFLTVFPRCVPRFVLVQVCTVQVPFERVLVSWCAFHFVLNAVFVFRPELIPLAFDVSWTQLLEFSINPLEFFQNYVPVREVSFHVGIF